MHRHWRWYWAGVCTGARVGTGTGVGVGAGGVAGATVVLKLPEPRPSGVPQPSYAVEFVSTPPVAADRANPLPKATVTSERALCVSIHDVAPDTWADCKVLLATIKAVAPTLPLTWLVVPRYHGRARAAPAMEAALGELLAGGDELALHGYTHLDSAARRPGLRNHFVRHIYTTGEGEFAALDYTEALQRLDLGLAWFAERGWPVDGFVPPAWLLSAAARRAVRERPFAYTTTLTHFHFLRSQRSLWSPSLMYSARHAAGRWLSPQLAEAFSLTLARNPLVRLALHPADARHPALLRHAQSLLQRLLAERQPMTKSVFCASYAGPSIALAEPEESRINSPKQLPSAPAHGRKLEQGRRGGGAPDRRL